MAITLILLVGFAAPILAAVACVVIARPLYPPGRRLWAGLAGVVGAIGLPLLVILTIRGARELHERLAGDLGPFVSIVLFAGASLVAPGMLLWLRKGNGKLQ